MRPERYVERGYFPPGYHVSYTVLDFAVENKRYLTPSMKPNDDLSAVHDLHLDEGGNLAMAVGADAVGEHARWRTKTYEGEWFLDIDAGVPWLQQIMGKAADLVLAETLIKAEVLGTAGVTAISGFSARYDRATRGIIVPTLDIETEDGSVVA